MKKLMIFAIMLFTLTTAMAQNDKKANSILSEISAKTKAYKSIKIDFTYAMDNAKQKVHDKFNGTLISKGDKYKLTAAGQDIICDGKTIWTYMKDAKEVQISNAGENDESFTPTKLLSDYSKNYKAKFVAENANEQLLELYPIKKGKSYTKVQLTVDKAKKQISKFVIYDKSGSTFSYIVNKFLTDQSVSDGTFTFNKTDHPGVEVNDMR